jgi:hypothetical protein
MAFHIASFGVVSRGWLSPCTTQVVSCSRSVMSARDGVPGQVLLTTRTSTVLRSRAPKYLSRSSLISYMRWVSLCGLSVSMCSGMCFGRSHKIRWPVHTAWSIRKTRAASTARHIACVWSAPHFVPVCMVSCPLCVIYVATRIACDVWGWINMCVSDALQWHNESLYCSMMNGGGFGM